MSGGSAESEDAVERLISEFTAAHRAGGEVDPRHYLNQVEGIERAELEALIDAYLDRAPGRRWDPEGFAGSRSEALIERFEQLLGKASREPAGEGEQLPTWSTLLPRLRNRAQLRRDALVSALAKALDLPAAKEEKVGLYYHRMEQGLLSPAGVSDRVIDALAAILSESAELLRRAGGAAAPPASPGATFARTAEPDPRYAASVEDADATADPSAPGQASPGEEAKAAEEAIGYEPAPDERDWDEVDELFRGGRPS
ncbi:MAG: hypothetical protein H0W09_07565 [Solirubrobacterales bacterium]|nr:hypothetical protein [Solirubrobacterales bacterium]